MIKPLHNDELGKLVVRLTLGLLLLLHGIAKILHPETLGFISGKLAEAGLPGFISYGIYIGEVIAPLMIILGIYCRIGGLIVIVNMLFAILLVHAHDLLSLGQHGGWAIELQGFYLFSALAVVFLGSGKIAIRPD